MMRNYSSPPQQNQRNEYGAPQPPNPFLISAKPGNPGEPELSIDEHILLLQVVAFSLMILFTYQCKKHFKKVSKIRK